MGAVLLTSLRLWTSKKSGTAGFGVGPHGDTLKCRRFFRSIKVCGIGIVPFRVFYTFYSLRSHPSAAHGCPIGCARSTRGLPMGTLVPKGYPWATDRCPMAGLGLRMGGVAKLAVVWVIGLECSCKSQANVRQVLVVAQSYHLCFLLPFFDLHRLSCRSSRTHTLRGMCKILWECSLVIENLKRVGLKGYLKLG